MKKILYLAGEAAPYAVSGGLGDVMGALPKAVAGLLKGKAEVAVLLPLYADTRKAFFERMKRVYEGELMHAERRLPFTVYCLKERTLRYFFLDNPRYFDRERLYGEDDDAERFAFLCHAALEFCLHYPYIPDILHANDWHTALAPVYIKTLYGNEPRFSSVQTVLTAHNLEYQGKFPKELLTEILGLAEGKLGIVEYQGCLNFLKGGIVCADRFTTVSPRYAEEIKGAEEGAGLDPLFRELGIFAKGIQNGIDTNAFSPARGTPLPYNAKTLEEGKAAAREEIAARFGISASSRPFSLVVSRLVEGKGLPLLLAAAPSILEAGGILFVLGTGEACYEKALMELKERYPERMRVVLRFDRELSKLLYAAADIFLMPSRYEPCGLAQMIACRYGAVPIVRETGGLADSIRPYGERDACGFLFRDYRPEALLRAFYDALMLFREQYPLFVALQRSAMRTDFSWRRRAGEYLALYREMLSEEL